MGEGRRMTRRAFRRGEGGSIVQTQKEQNLDRKERRGLFQDRWFKKREKIQIPLDELKSGGKGMPNARPKCLWGLGGGSKEQKTKKCQEVVLWGASGEHRT